MLSLSISLQKKSHRPGFCSLSLPTRTLSFILNMPRERSRRPSRKSQNTEQPSRPAPNDPDDDHRDGNSNDPMEKDEVEEELERLVFGDEGGFKRGLELHTQQSLEEASEKDEEQGPKTLNGDNSQEEGLGGVDDADVSEELFLILGEADCS